MTKISRRQLLTAAGAGAAALAGYSTLGEAHWLETKTHTIPTGAPHQPVRILHISDLHASWCVSLAYITEAIERGMALRPDVVCLTGDFITSTFGDTVGYARVLSKFVQGVPVYASLGNHDGGHWSSRRGGYTDTTWVRSLLAASGITILHNQSTDIFVNKRPLRFVGVGDMYSGEFAPGAAFARPTLKSAPYTVLLSHNPDTKGTLANYPWHIMLSGHTHGGQVCLPLIGAPYLPTKDKKYIAGLYPWRDRWVHITKGVGNMFGIRFDCRPDISLLTLA